MVCLYRNVIGRTNKGSVVLIFLDIYTHKWVEQANCASTDPDSFFPESDSSNTKAKNVCANCYVAQQCLDYAMEDMSLSGIWGGVTHTYRKQLATQRRRNAQVDAQAS
jgi:hypothetical protein